MKTDTMRRIDRLAGSPLCHVFAAIKGAFEKPAAKNAPVVVCKFFGMGSICLAYPLLRKLRAADRRVVFLSFAANAPILDHLGIEERIVIDPSSAVRFFASVMAATLALRRIGPAVFLNLEFFSRFAALMSVLSGAGTRAGFHIVHLPVGKLYTQRANLNVYRHIAENFLNVGIAAGVIAEAATQAALFREFPVPEDTLPGLPDGPYIVLNGESSETLRDLKSWPREAWRELIAGLRRQYPAHSVVLLGTSAAADVYGGIAGMTEADTGLVNMIGKTAVADLLKVIAKADVVITVDSGPLHMSAMMKRPTVCLFGPESPHLYGHAVAWVRTLYKGLHCSPCLALYDAKQSVLNCRDNQCMQQIAVGEVLEAVSELLPSAKRPARAS